MKYLLSLVIIIATTSCTSVTATRPDQELTEAITALKAAKEVQADRLSPGMFRKAQEQLDIAKRDYRLKNYEEARIAFKKSRLASEHAELAALKSGGVRQEAPKDPMADATANASPSPEATPTPEPTPESTPEPAPEAPTEAPANTESTPSPTP